MKLEKLNFIRLGSRDGWFRRLGIGNKSALLNHAVKSRLPVPNALVLPDNAWKMMIEDGILAIDADGVTVNSADEMLERFALNKPRYNVAVRSAFSAEDRAEESLAGFFKTILNVPKDDKAALINALVDVWQSADLRDGDFRRDIMVMEMVAAEVAGVAFTQGEHEDDLVNYTGGTADKLVGGEVEGDSLTMPKLRGWEQSSFAPSWQRRLQNLLRGVRRSFNLKGTNWDIEWADDGKVCWLLQIRPITSPPRRNEAFTYANLKEILPDPPSPFMTSVVADASRDFFAWYRQFDKTLPESRNMVEVFYGRPLFNLSLLTDMMRHWGLPSTLVTNSIGGHSDADHPFRFGRFLRKSFVLLRLGWGQLNAVHSAEAAHPELLAQAHSAEKTFTGLSNAFRDLFVAFVTEMFNLTQAMSGPLLLLRNSDALDATRDVTVTTQLFQQFSHLRTLVADDAMRQSLSNGQIPDNPQFAAAWATFLTDFGHRGVYESDIARPRHRETAPELLRSLAIGINTSSQSPALPASPSFLLRPIAARLRTVQAARERWRHNTMHIYEVLRGDLLTLADGAVQRGQLPSSELLWMLSKDEMATLDDGGVFSAEFFQTRAAEVEQQQTIEVPDFIHRFDNLLAASMMDDLEPGSMLTGVSLSDGNVKGRAWVLRDPAMQLPEGFTPETTILVARSIDAGWIPTFGLVSGVVVEIGGDLSHGSILLREVGIPAITNVRHATRQISDGESLTLDAGHGIVTRDAAS